MLYLVFGFLHLYGDIGFCKYAYVCRTTPTGCLSIQIVSFTTLLTTGRLDFWSSDRNIRRVFLVLFLYRGLFSSNRPDLPSALTIAM